MAVLVRRRITVTEDNSLLKSIAKNPKEYLEYETRSLQERIEAVTLSEEQKEKVKIDTTVEAGGSTIKSGLSILTAGTSDIVFEVLNWKKRLDENMDDAKKSILMAEYMKKFDTIEQGVDNLERVLSDLYGQTLFSKIDNMVADNPLDDEVIKKLSNVMKTISDSDNVEAIFPPAKQVLNIIDKLSPMSLYMIGEFPKWPTFSMQMMMSMGGRVNGFESHFVDAYKSCNPQFDKNSIETAVNEMSSSGLIYGALLNQNNNVIKANLTDTGRFLYKAIT